MFTRAYVGMALSLISLTATALVIAPSCLASRLATHSTQEQSQRNVPLKFDEYGATNECDEGARLDNFAIQLQNEPTSKGYIISYDGRNTLPARLGHRLLYAMDYLINSRGMPPDRIVAVKGGYREETITELWIAPSGAPAPEPSDTIEVSREADKAFKYDEFHPQTATVEYPDESEILQQEDMDAENEALPLQQESESIQQAPVEQPAPSQERIIDDLGEAYDDTLWASKNYAQALGEKSVACVIYYAQREDGHLFRLDEIIEGGQNLLVSKYGIQTDRIKTIFGGYRENTTIELWIMPPGASLPAPTPDYEQGNKTTNDELGMMNDE